MAELMGTLLYANTFTADCIRIVTESAEFARRLPYLLRKAAATKFDGLPEAGVAGKLTLCVTDPAKIAHVFARCGFSAETSVSLHVTLGLLENDCCRRAFLRGAFLAGGSVTDPEKRYHLELSTTHLKVSRETELLLDELALKPKATERKGSSVLYFKQSEAIEEFLTLIGAPIEKDWRNDANRKTNCDAANVDKAVAAAQEQLAALRRLEERGQFDTLPEKLRQTAELRRAHPEVTLQELAELHEPPLTKSAVNHRLRKLLALGNEA